MEDINELYAEIVKLARANGAVDQEAWDGLVDEVVEQFRTDGQIHDDEDTDALEEDLRARFPEYDELVREEGL